MIQVSNFLKFQLETVRQLNDEKIHTMQLMVEQEKRFVDQLRQQLATGTKKESADLAAAVKRLAKLQEQLDNLKQVRSAFISRDAICLPL